MTKNKLDKETTGQDTKEPKSKRQKIDPADRDQTMSDPSPSKPLVTGQTMTGRSPSASLDTAPTKPKARTSAKPTPGPANPKAQASTKPIPTQVKPKAQASAKPTPAQTNPDAQASMQIDDDKVTKSSDTASQRKKETPKVKSKKTQEQRFDALPMPAPAKHETQASDPADGDVMMTDKSGSTASKKSRESDKATGATLSATLGTALTTTAAPPLVRKDSFHEFGDPRNMYFKRTPSGLGDTRTSYRRNPQAYLKTMMHNIQDLGGGPARGSIRSEDQIQNAANKIADHDLAVILEVKTSSRPAKAQTREDIAKNDAETIQIIRARLSGHLIGDRGDIIKAIKLFQKSEGKPFGISHPEFAKLCNGLDEYGKKQRNGGLEIYTKSDKEFQSFVEKQILPFIADARKRSDYFDKTVPTQEQQDKDASKEPKAAASDKDKAKKLEDTPGGKEIERIKTKVQAKKSETNRNHDVYLADSGNGEAVALFFNKDVVKNITHKSIYPGVEDARQIIQFDVQLKNPQNPDGPPGEQVTLLALHAPYNAQGTVKGGENPSRAKALQALAATAQDLRSKGQKVIICADTNVQTATQEDIMRTIVPPQLLGTTLGRDGKPSASRYDYLSIVDGTKDITRVGHPVRIEAMMSGGRWDASTSISDHYGQSMQLKTTHYNQENTIPDQSLARQVTAMSVDSQPASSGTKDTKPETPVPTPTITKHDKAPVEKSKGTGNPPTNPAALKKKVQGMQKTMEKLAPGAFSPPPSFKPGRGGKGSGLLT